MDPRPIIALVALTLVLTAAEPPAPRALDFNPWAWLPTSRNRSPSIMDYFFPPSRTPKHSVLDPPADRTPPDTTVSQATTSSKTTPEMLTTTRKASTAGKTKSTLPATLENVPPPTATVPPKIKKQTQKTSVAPQTTMEVRKISQKTSAVPETTLELKTTQGLKTEKTSGTTTPPKVTYVSSTARPTKRYTIRPIVKETEKPTVTQSESTLNTEESDSTETVAMTGSTDITGSTYSGSGKDTGPTLSTVAESRSTGTGGTTLGLETSTNTPDAAEAPDSREGYLPLRDKPQQIVNDPSKKETVPLPAGSASVLAKPTKYHYYPHNQHLYYLPECAIQQVCNAVYVRLNYTQPLCACPSRYGNPCSASLNADDGHTLRLTSSDSKKKYAHKAVTLVKTCEAVSEVRDCRTATDWSLLALQNIRTGKSHYLVLCRCPESSILEGPKSHDQPSYASIPGIRVFGMMCVNPIKYQLLHTTKKFLRVTKPPSTTSSYKVDYTQPHYTQEQPEYNRFTSHSYLGPNYYNRMSRAARVRRETSAPPFPWYKVKEFANTIDLDSSL